METRQRTQFSNGDLLDHIAWARHVLVVIALLMPLVFLARIEGVQAALSRMLSSPKNQALECLAKGQTIQAAAALRSAVAANSGDPALLRMFADAAAAALPGEARRCYNQLEKIGATTDTDLARHSMLLAKMKDFTGAKSLLLKIGPNARETSLTQYAWLSLRKAEGDFSSAADVLDKLLAGEAKVDVSTCLDVMEAAGRTPLAPDTLDRLENLAAKALVLSGLPSETTSRQAVAFRIASMPWHTTRSRMEVAKVLRAVPGKPAEFRLAAVRLGFPANVDTANHQALRAAWLEEITTIGGLSAEDKDRVTAYLQMQHEYELVTELVPVAEAYIEYPLFVRRIDCLMELGRWREVGAMCANPDAPPLPHLRLVSQTMAALHKTGPQTCMAERLLLDAFNESREEENATACYATGCAALDHRLSELASNAFAAALDLSKDRRSTMEAIINSSRHGPLAAAQLLRAFETTPVFSDESVQNQLIYLHLLAGRDLDHMTAVIRQRRAVAPDDVYLRFLDAFAMHLHGDYAQAARQLVPLPRYRWHQGEAAVIAGIVTAAGSFDRSAALISKISLSEIFAEERSMAEPWQHRPPTGPSSLLSKADVAGEQQGMPQ